MFDLPEATIKSDHRASLPPLDLEKIREMYQDGSTIAQLAELFQATERNIEAAIGHDRIQENKDVGILMLYRAGLSMEGIANLIGWSYSKVRGRIPPELRRSKTHRNGDR